MNYLNTFFDNAVLAATTEPNFWLAWGATLWNITQVALGLGFVIFVHELGHFLAAKFFGVKCEKFYIGFDVPISIGPIKLPAKLLHFQWGETEYGIGSIPLGGYVKMLGQDDDPRNAEKENDRIRVADSSTDSDPVPSGRAQFDPRSFPAKSVFARMVIISAGVIMNVIFGILFAAIAFSWGVSYEPTIIGDVMPGDPAWVAGLKSGDQIVQVAEMKEPDKQLAYRDMVESIALAGFDTPTEPVPVTVLRNGNPIQFNVVGTRRHDPEGYLMRLGLIMPLTTKLSDRMAIKSSLSKNWPEANETLPLLEKGDTIVGVNGKKLPIQEGHPVPMEHELDRIVHPLFDQTVTLQVERLKNSDAASKKVKDTLSKPAIELVEVQWKPLPMRTLGFGFQVGDVKAIQVDSPAAKAGIQLGDIPTKLDGQAIEDAFTLPLAIAKRKGESVTLTLARGSETVNLTWTVPESFVLRDSGIQYDPVGIELPGSGLVFAPTNKIASVASTTGTGLKAGDLIKQIRLDPQSTEEADSFLADILGKENYAELLRGKQIEGGYSAQFIHSLIQSLPIRTTVHVYTKNETVKDELFTVTNDSKWFQPDRGLVNTPLELNRRVETMGAAIGMGVKEIQRQAFKVLRFVKMVFSWKIPRKAAAGPGMIFYAATSAASEGFPDLLMFLTMLSANLAVLNFLPVPALDGGHMMFLIAEAIRGKPVDENLQMRLTVVGVLALLGLMIFVTFNDVMNLSRLLG